MTVVTIVHCREMGYCVRGVRAKTKSLGIDFRRLVREGIPSSELEGISDHGVQRILEHAKAQEELS